MRSVHGLDRPWIQWTFVGLGVVLVALAAAQAIVLRRTRVQLDAARTAEVNARLDRRQLDLELARERSTREALAIEVSRLRDAAGSSGAGPPTLTLTPLGKRGAAPPSASVARPEPDQVIELRLTLPRDLPQSLKAFTIALRTWSGGETVWMRSGLARDRDRPGEVAALMTGEVLAPGAYELLLSATDQGGQAREVATYEVTIGPSGR